MRFTNMIAVGALTAVLGGGQALLAADGFFGHDRGYNERDYDRFDRGRISYQREDLRRDYRRVEELRAEIARDRARLDCHIREGREMAAAADARDLARDQRMLNELMRHIERKREASYRDQRDNRYDSRDPRNGFPGSGYRR